MDFSNIEAFKLTVTRVILYEGIVGCKYTLAGAIGSKNPKQKKKKLVCRLACRSNIKVLLLGESGTLYFSTSALAEGAV